MKQREEALLAKESLLTNVEQAQGEAKPMQEIYDRLAEKLQDDFNKMNQEKVQQKIQHGKTQSIDNDLKLLIEFDEKEQLHKELEQTLINLEDKNRELQKENVRIKEEYEKWVFILKQKNYEKKNIIAEEKIKIV